jgi:uncharacterized integral membrane protein
MYKLFFILIALVAIFCGLLLGTLNAEPVQLDLLWVQLNWPLGLVTVMALALGIVLGSLASWVLQVWPLKLALRRERAGKGQAPAALPDESHD